MFTIKTSNWFHTKENLQVYLIYSAMFSVQIPVILFAVNTSKWFLANENFPGDDEW